MGINETAHSKVITLLNSYAPSPLWENVYTTHATANLIIPALSIEVETDIALEDDNAIYQNELLDNRNIQLSIRIHTGYRLGPINTTESIQLTDDVIRWLREHIDLADNYRIFEVSATAHNVDHSSSGTIGSEIIINIHKVENYEQS